MTKFEFLSLKTMAENHFNALRLKAKIVNSIWMLGFMSAISLVFFLLHKFLLKHNGLEEAFTFFDSLFFITVFSSFGLLIRNMDSVDSDEDKVMDQLEDAFKKGKTVDQVMEMKFFAKFFPALESEEEE